MSEFDDFRDPEEWLAEYEKQVEQLREKSEEAQQRLGTLGSTGKALDGGVTVTIGNKGQLSNVQISDSAYHQGPAKISQAIKQAYDRAFNATIAESREIMVDLIGEEATEEYLAYVHPIPEEPAEDELGEVFEEGDPDAPEDPFLK